VNDPKDGAKDAPETQIVMLDVLEDLIELMDETGVHTREEAVRRLAELEAGLDDDDLG